jgi:hypothetical protein
MFSHERFRQLSAIAAMRHLSNEEESELESHLRECTSCRDAHGDYARVVRHLLQEDQETRAEGFETLLHEFTAERRERFFSRARNQGVNLSIEAEQATPLPPDPSFDVQWPALRVIFSHLAQHTGRGTIALSAAALVLIMASAVWFARIDREARSPAAQVARVSPVPQDTSLPDELAALRQQVSKQALQIADSEKALVALRQSRRRLLHTNKAKDASIANLRADNERMTRERQDDLVMKQIIDAHVAEVSHELAGTRATLDRVSQLLTVTPDVLKMMGARRLHIVDVYDVDESGNSVKSFGRVFYAENQAFVFYAFDLPNGGLNTSSSEFYAWGQRDDEPKSPRNLGTFKFDSEQHRWVLKVKDPALLAGMNYVFVTAGPRYGFEKPLGRKLLNAYIGGKPNIP